VFFSITEEVASAARIDLFGQVVKSKTDVEIYTVFVW
jgi:hypothetical protein